MLNQNKQIETRTSRLLLQLGESFDLKSLKKLKIKQNECFHGRRVGGFLGRRNSWQCQVALTFSRCRLVCSWNKLFREDDSDLSDLVGVNS